MSKSSWNTSCPPRNKVIEMKIVTDEMPQEVVGYVDDEDNVVLDYMSIYSIDDVTAWRKTKKR